MRSDLPLFISLYLSGSSAILCSIGFALPTTLLNIAVGTFVVSTAALGYFAHKDSHR